VKTPIAFEKFIDLICHMKRTPPVASFLLGWITLILLTALPACKKSNSSTSSISATVNSTSFQSISGGGTFYPDQLFGPFHLFGKMLSSGDSSFLILNFSHTVNENPFQVNVPFSIDTTYAQLIYSAPNGIDNYEATGNYAYGYSSGSNVGHAIITITGWDSVGCHIAGTFSGTFINLSGGDSVIVANGKFNMKYVESIP
jgi:hypothetical protein